MHEMIEKWGRERLYISLTYSCTIYILYEEHFIV